MPHSRLILGLGVLAAAVLPLSPASGSPARTAAPPSVYRVAPLVHSTGATALASATRSSTTPAGLVFGGKTAQSWPVTLELQRDGRKIADALAGVAMACTSGAHPTIADGYKRVPVTKTGAFESSFGAMRMDLGDGMQAELSGSFDGKLNARRTKASGTWQLKASIFNASAQVVDSCDSGKVAWTAKQ